MGPRIPLAKDGYYFASYFLLLGLVLNAYVSSRLAILSYCCGLFSLFFFRDPTRKIPSVSDGIISAADGKIGSIEEFYEPEFIKGPAVRIVTILSLFNVHINRAPIDGKVVYQRLEKGKFHPAHLTKAVKNQKNYIGIENDQISVMAVQMVGIIARRIVSWVEEGESIFKGDKIGLIRFGSRTDVIIPKSRLGEIMVKPGDKVKGGETILATIKNN